MLLYVMRHGSAEDHAPTGRDFDRRLTAEGQKLVQGMAAVLRAHRGGADLPRVISSPRVRARETAAIVRAAIGPAEATVELDDRLGGEQPIPGELVSALAEGGADTLLVGHQPTVEDLCRGLIRPEPLVISGFRTATIVALASDGARFRLVSVLDPRDARA